MKGVKLTSRGLADNCQILAVRSDNCQIGQLSVGTTVSGDNCQRTNCQRKLSELFWHWDNCKILQFFQSTDSFF